MKHNLSMTFFEDSISYYNAAIILSSCEQRNVDDQLFLTPILYLYRHSAELVIKAIILSYLERFSTENSIKDFFLYSEDGEKTKLQLMNCHSLNSLYSCLKYFDKNERIVSVFDDNELDFIDRVIKEIELIDKNSDYFRYPIGKNKEQHKRKFLAVSETDIMPDLSKVYQNFIYEGPNDKVITFTSIEQEYIELSENIRIMTNILIRKYKKDD